MENDFVNEKEKNVDFYPATLQCICPEDPEPSSKIKLFISENSTYIDLGRYTIALEPSELLLEAGYLFPTNIYINDADTGVTFCDNYNQMRFEGPFGYFSVAPSEDFTKLEIRSKLPDTFELRDINLNFDIDTSALKILGEWVVDL